MNNIDIAIIGAGSAGSIIANKLLSETNFNIALIEAGPKDNNPIIDVPLGYGMTFYNKKINWNFYSEKQDNLFNRQIYYPRGKVLGGSGSINAMVYARGLETDYENWGSNKEWSFENIKKVYSSMEQQINDNKEFLIKEKIPVNNVSKHHHPILEYFFNASNEIGIKKPLILWINEGLMAVFFCLVVLELKQEFKFGELSNTSQIMFPATAATCLSTSNPLTISFNEFLPIIVSASTTTIISPFA